MGFNRKDLEDDDDFNFDDDNAFDFGDSSDTGDDFKFDDEPSDIGLDDDAGGFGFEDEDMPEIEEDQSEGGGVSRTFIIIAALMILLFVGGLIVVLVVALGPGSGPSEFEQTRAAIIAQNGTTAADSLLTETAKSILAVTETFIAQQPTSTPTLAPTDTVAAPPTFTPTPTLDDTALAAAAIQTQQAFDLTQTAAFLLTPPTPTQGVGADDVALTATELARILAPGTATPGGLIPTAEGFLTPGANPTALPDTGFFDDLAAGTGNVGTIALMAFGLAGVILVSRRLRTSNK